MIDIATEQLLTMSEVAKMLPGHPNPATLYRWRTKGCRGIRLETVLIGGKRRVTSVEALKEFITAVTTAADQSAS